MNYIRQADDKAYRIVSLTVSGVPPFTAFTIPEQTISINDSYVLEIEKEDGQSVIAGPDQRTVVRYTVVDAKRISIPASLPYARLWARHCAHPLPRYKVPLRLFAEPANNRVLMLFAGGAQNIILFGDKYFEAVYDLQKG